MKRKSCTILVICLLCMLFAGTSAYAQEPDVVVSGTWKLSLTFITGTATHTAVIIREGKKLTGVYKGEIKEGTLFGVVDGNKVVFTGSVRHEATGVQFRYTGTVDGDSMEGTVDMGEYWTASFTGKRIADTTGNKQ